MTTLTKAEITQAKWIADLMIKDGVTPENFKEFGEELLLAYADEVTRKIKRIQGIYLTSNGAKDAMINAVFATCKKAL